MKLLATRRAGDAGSVTATAPAHSTDPGHATGVRIVETDRLAAWAADWDALVERQPLPTPFLKSWWIEGVGGIADHLVLVVDGDTLLGGLALERRRRWGVDVYTVAGGGKLCPDHLDLVAQPDRVADVVAALRVWWRAPGARVLDLDGLRDDSLLASSVAPEGRVAQIDVAPFEALTGDPDDFVARRSNSFAKSHRKYGRRLERAGVSLRRLPDADVPAAMASFSALHEVRDDRTELARELPRVRRAVELGTAAGDVWVHVAECDGRTGAVLLMFRTENRLCVYQTARAVEDASFNHVGAVLDVVAIREASTEGLSEIDFLRGDEPYKRSFVADERGLHRLRAGHGLRGRALVAASLAVGRLRTVLGDLRRVLAARRAGASD